jgi:BirA family biotin operon repressor/biotin-[acetyl-CoA-carboxylase] ligase
MRFDRVPSTQDEAQEEIDALPLLVIAAAQTRGRGRSGAEWLNADRALAVSLAVHHDDGDERPFSLMAGVAAHRSIEGISLKWPNDLLKETEKVGGILVERNGSTTVIGLGLNLWWPQPPPGTSAVYQADPGESRHAEIGALWGAELMDIIESPGWPIEAYRETCATIGRKITWEPDGTGRAVDVSPDGSLVVETSHGLESIYSGAIRHVRNA